MSGNEAMVIRAAFLEITHAKKAGWPVVLCVAEYRKLPQDVREELVIGLQRTDIEFVLFEEDIEACSLLSRLLPASRVIEV